jgi:nucleotide-binding universal stress UspA family protein
MARILVAVSSPWAAARLIEPVASLAASPDSQVIVAHVSRPSGGEQREQELVEGESAVRALAEKLASRGIAVQTLITFSDDIARAVLNTAVDREATMIVLGLTGRNMVSRLLAGNVPVELIRETRIPVVLIPPDWDRAV